MTSIGELIGMEAGYWNTSVVGPYIGAYNTAYTSFQATLKQQQDSDKAQADLFVAIASVMSTSIVMATFASYPLGRLSTRFALRTLGSSNTKAVIGLYRQAAADPITTFVFGKVMISQKRKRMTKPNLWDLYT